VIKSIVDFHLSLLKFKDISSSSVELLLSNFVEIQLKTFYKDECQTGDGINNFNIGKEKENSS